MFVKPAVAFVLALAIFGNAAPTPNSESEPSALTGMLVKDSLTHAKQLPRQSWRCDG